MNKTNRIFNILQIKVWVLRAFFICLGLLVVPRCSVIFRQSGVFAFLPFRIRNTDVVVWQGSSVQTDCVLV